MHRRFGVEGNHIRSCFFQVRKVGFRMLGHEMHIKKKLRMRTQRFDDGRAEGEIGYEMVIHHIQVDQVGSPSFDILYFRCQIGKISR